jgi:cysteine desulfurase
MNNPIIYLDAAATTPVDPRVLEAMLPYFSEIFGNASSNHIYGKDSKRAVDVARAQVATLLNASESEIFFTSGATEAINWAIKGYLEANPEKGNHIITVKTEHKAVLNTCEYLETKGYEVTYLDVYQNGLISLDDLKKSISTNTSLICVMLVNNEIGVIQDISGISKIATEHGIAFFTDATQAIGHMPADVTELNVDMLCLSAHKFGGPKGIGALFIRNEIKVAPLIHGGGQEKGLRGGTYNTPLIVGLGKAAELAKDELEIRINSLLQKRQEIAAYYEQNDLGTVNFKDVPTAPHILSITLKNQEVEDYLLLNSQKFAASTGSACSSGVVDISHVLKAMGSKFNCQNIIRISV